MAAYYNELEPFAADWLRNLIRAGLIADGEVDTRSIVDVQPDDLRGFTQCHFFAGIGGWSYALRLAGWPDDRAVWTGSCPCQPFSAAGKGDGTADPRHLWPTWFRLIRECRPSVVFGEQVAAAITHGWLDLVSDDLEDCDYAVGAAVLPAASVGAPHRRDRLWFVAHANGRQQARRPAGRAEADYGRSHGKPPRSSDADRLVANSDGRGQRRERGGGLSEDGHASQRNDADGRGANGAWADVVWLPCRDGKARPTEPGLQPLADGLPGRVGRLRAYGNAIVPQVAAEFIGAYLEAREG